jgi:hypothetical protein
MAFYKVTQFNPGPPIDLDDTNIVYLEAEDGGDLLLVSMSTHSKPVKTYEEVSESVYNANK